MFCIKRFSSNQHFQIGHDCWIENVHDGQDFGRDFCPWSRLVMCEQEYIYIYIYIILYITYYIKLKTLSQKSGYIIKLVTFIYT